MSLWCLGRTILHLKDRDFTFLPNSGLWSLLSYESEGSGHPNIMIKWMNQLIIRNKCHWIQNSRVTVKEGTITLANPIKSIIRLFSHIFFSHINSLVFPPSPVLVLWLMNMQCEIQIIAPSTFIWIIAPLHNQINLLSVFAWMFSHVHGITYSNKCSCVFYNVWGSRYTQAC